jgi:hypothetical protein
MIKEVWNSVVDEEDTMRCWQSKIRRLHQHLRGWAKNTSGVNKKEKNMLDKLDSLDLKQCLNTGLSELLREEEIKWY